MLKSRLLKIAGLVPKGASVVDVGADHAFLSIYLIKNKIAESVIACDINEGPLAAARKNIAAARVGSIDVRQSNGLEHVLPTEVDTIIVAGMGGELIAKIIKGAQWTKNSKYRFILQPMSSAEDLRKYLCDNKFQIIAEHGVTDCGKIYSVMEVRYVGMRQSYNTMFLHFGKTVDNLCKDNVNYIKSVLLKRKKL
ncbi:MAG: class I SAM-dependent methyltransferase, partial [Oscillospiraceae bacterium]